jgi:hypothetical protein
MERYPLE